MNSILLRRHRLMSFGWVPFIAIGLALVSTGRVAHGQAIQIYFSSSNSNPLSNSIQASAGTTIPIYVWAVVTDAAVPDTELGISSVYLEGQSAVTGNGAFSVGTKGVGVASTVGAQSFAPAVPFEGTGQTGTAGLDNNSDGVADAISTTGKNGDQSANTDNKTTSPSGAANAYEFGGNANGVDAWASGSTNAGQAAPGTSGGVGGWAWNIGSFSFTEGSTTTGFTGTTAFTPVIPATKSQLTFNGGQTTSPAGGSTLTSLTPTIGSGLTFTAVPAGTGNTSVLTLKPTSTASPNTATAINFTPPTGTGYLLNATVPTQTMTLTESGGSATTYTNSASPSGFTVTDNSGTPGSIAANGSDTYNVTLNTSTAGNFSGNYVVTNTGGSTATQGNLSVALAANVGVATTDKTATGTFTGTVLSASVANAGLYTNLASSSNSGAPASNGSLPGVEGSTAVILLGTNNQGATMTPSMTWRSRNANETPLNDSAGGTGFVNGHPTSPPLPGGNNPLGLISDVVDLYGMSSASAAPTGSATGTVAPVQTDPFAFEINFNPKTLNAEGSSGTAMASHGNLYLASLVPIAGVANWQNTIIADFAPAGGKTALYGPVGGTQQTIQVGSSATAAMNAGNPKDASSGTFDFPLLESFSAFQTANSVTAANLANFVGVWGVDTTNDEAWSIVNHNSEFAVVPEPSTLVLAAFGLLGGALTLRRKKNAAAA